jgi:hypothetical protein
MQDHIPDAMARTGFQYPGSIFYRYAVSTGYRGRNAEDKARELEEIYKVGYSGLPQPVRDFVLELCNQERREARKSSS